MAVPLRRGAATSEVLSVFCLSSSYAHDVALSILIYLVGSVSHAPVFDRQLLEAGVIGRVERNEDQVIDPGAGGNLAICE